MSLEEDRKKLEELQAQVAEQLAKVNQLYANEEKAREAVKTALQLALRDLIREYARKLNLATYFENVLKEKVKLWVEKTTPDEYMEKQLQGALRIHLSEFVGAAVKDRAKMLLTKLVEGL